MNREAIVPVDDVDAWFLCGPLATMLAPGARSIDGRRPWTSGSAMARIDAWQETIILHDEHGRPFRFPPTSCGTPTAPG